MQKIALLFLAIPVITLSLSHAIDLKIYRLNDIVGDTIDAFERLQYNLFPNITNFESAIILTNNDTIYVAEINCRQADSATKLFFRVTPRGVEKISYCIENADTIRNQVARDEFARLALEKFWIDIELKPITNLSDLSIQSRPKSVENRAAGIIWGTTIGTAFGGYIASQLAIKQTSPGGWEYLGSYMCPIMFPYPPTYHVNHFTFWTVSALGTAAGAMVGYKIGKDADRKNSLATVQYPIENKWQNGCTALSILPALALGALTISMLGSTKFGATEPLWYNMENDPHDLTAIPAVITGIGVTVSTIYLSSLIGRSIDRANAAKKNTKPTK
jgi:hypothetical protein